MTNKVTIPVFDMASFTADKQIMNSIETASKNSQQHFTISKDMIPHDSLFIADVIEFEVTKINTTDIFLLTIGNHVYLRKISFEKDIIRFEPILSSASENVVLVDKNIKNLKIIGKFKRKILVLDKINGEV